MDTIKNLVTWLQGQSTVTKILALIAGIIIGVISLFFVSCSSIQRTIPSITQNQVGAEGVVSKEKNVQRQTKWFFKPDEPLSNTKLL